MSPAKAKRIFLEGISAKPEVLTTIFKRLETPMEHRVALTAYMSKLVAEGEVQIVPGGDSEEDQRPPMYYRTAQKQQRTA